MVAFREHFLEKYFWYRKRYVDFVAREAPRRAVLANLSEVARLTFVAAAATFIAALLWLLTVAAAERGAFAAVAFALGAAAASAAGIGAATGVVLALRDRPRVQERSRAAANDPSR